MRRPAVILLGACPLVAAVAAATFSEVASAVGGSSATAVVAIADRGGATLSLADGSAAEGLPWLLPGDADVAFSPDGRRIAFSSERDGNRELYVADVATGDLTRLTRSPGSEDVGPAWSPNGRRLVWASGAEGDHDLWVMRLDGTKRTPLVRRAGDDVEPDWSSDGTLVAFASDGDGRYGIWTVSPAGGEAEPLGDLPGQARAPAWHPSGERLAYTGIVAGNADVWQLSFDGLVSERLVAGKGFEGRPDWSADGRTLGFVRGRGPLTPWLARADGTGARQLTGGSVVQIDLASVGRDLAPRRDALLPDLDQRPPAGLVIRSEGGRVWLGFASAVDNIGAGPLRIRGTRLGERRVMRADQLVETRGGGVVVRRGVGGMRFESHPPHHHWHLDPFDGYELRRASDGSLVRRDRKTGFCLLDRWGTAPLPPGARRGPPHFLGDCAAGRPDARSVEEGSSVGYTDRYPQFFHGQEVDVTDVPAGAYVVVHRANPERRMRERSYANNVASVRVLLRRPGGMSQPPTVEVVRACDGTDRCGQR